MGRSVHPFETPTLKVLMESAGGDFSKLKIVNIGDTDPLALIAGKQIDMAWIFYGWEGIEAQATGYQAQCGNDERLL